MDALLEAVESVLPTEPRSARCYGPFPLVVIQAVLGMGTGMGTSWAIGSRRTVRRPQQKKDLEQASASLAKLQQSCVEDQECAHRGGWNGGWQKCRALLEEDVEFNLQLCPEHLGEHVLWRMAKYALEGNESAGLSKLEPLDEMLKFVPTDAWGIRVLSRVEAMQTEGWRGGRTDGARKVKKTRLVQESVDPLTLEQARVLHAGALVCCLCGSQEHHDVTGDYGHPRGVRITVPCQKKLEEGVCGQYHARTGPLATSCHAGLEGDGGQEEGLQRGALPAPVSECVLGSGVGEYVAGQAAEEVTEEASRGDLQGVGEVGVLGCGVSECVVGRDAEAGKEEASPGCPQGGGSEWEGEKEEGFKAGELEPEDPFGPWWQYVRPRNLVGRVRPEMAWGYSLEGKTAEAECALEEADAAEELRHFLLAYGPRDAAELEDVGQRVGPLLVRMQLVRLRVRKDRSFFVVIHDLRGCPTHLKLMEAACGGSPGRPPVEAARGGSRWRQPAVAACVGVGVCVRCEWAGGVSGGGGRQEDRWVDTVCGALEGHCGPGTVKRAPGGSSLYVPTGGCGGSPWRPPAEAAYGGSPWRQPVEAACRGSLWRQPAEAAWGGAACGDSLCVCEE